MKGAFGANEKTLGPLTTRTFTETLIETLADETSAPRRKRRGRITSSSTTATATASKT